MEGLTLAVDCGGGGVKAAALDTNGTLVSKPRRFPLSYPLPPGALIGLVQEIAAAFPPAQRLTLGMPGMIRHGVVVHTPHYINRAGPGTKLDPALAEAWEAFDMRAELRHAIGLPSLVLNDAELHGCGVVTGTGSELAITLGTGLGTALFDAGRLAPHLEVSHAPVRRGVTFDEFVGEKERLALGDPLWSRRVVKLLDLLFPVFWWDRCYVGGGNSRMITPAALARLPDHVVIVSNTAGLRGAVRAWSLAGPGPGPSPSQSPNPSPNPSQSPNPSPGPNPNPNPSPGPGPSPSPSQSPNPSPGPSQSPSPSPSPG
ncbi:MAG: ROK family protein [Bifidobacteriaceae bacterium]|jgi:polyphosphate glucokinase|nr:ROK family protein [Bifidobacteriaceae bacterium]